MLGLSRPAVKYRSTEHKDFPEPLAQLRAGPVWARDDILAYARSRSRFQQPCNLPDHQAPPACRHQARPPPRRRATTRLSATLRASGVASRFPNDRR